MALHSIDTREARFTRVYEEHLETIRRYVWRRDPELVDDVVAETFLVAWRRVDDIPENAAAWLIGVARNVRRNTRRSARRQEAVSARLADAVPPLDCGGAPHEAAALGCSRANVSVRLHRARRRLEGSLAAPHHDLGARIALAPRRR